MQSTVYSVVSKDPAPFSELKFQATAYNEFYCFTDRIPMQCFLRIEAAAALCLHSFHLGKSIPAQI